MDDDPFGSSVWATEPGTFSPPKASSSQLDATFLPPPTNHEFDEFDEFGEASAPAEQATDDDDFGDFEDFGDSEVVEASTFHDNFEGDPTATPTPPRKIEMLQLDPLPSRLELRAQIERLLEPIFPQNEMARLMTDEPIREVQGVNQILVTEER